MRANRLDLRPEQEVWNQAREFLRKHGFSADDLKPLPGGTVNEVWSTEHHVLRIGSRTDHLREARLADSALEVGVRTAKAVAWGNGYSIWQRLSGRSCWQAESVSEKVWEELLDDLERLHAQPLEAIGTRPSEEDRTSASRLIEQTDEPARWTKSERDSLTGLLRGTKAQGTSAFIHGDAFARNVLVDDHGAYLALIDWGCAGWASLEAECARLENVALEIAKKRWGDMLNIGLLELLRLEFLLQILIQGRVGTGAVREQLRIAAELQ